MKPMDKNRSTFKIRSIDHGFTMMELVVVVCIVGLFFAIAIPAFPALTKANAKRATKEIFEADIMRARMIGLSRNARGVFTFSPQNTNYTFGIDYYPYNDPAASDETVFRTFLPFNCKVTPSAQIIFNSRGLATDVNGVYTSPSIVFATSDGTYSTGTLYPAGRILY